MSVSDVPFVVALGVLGFTWLWAAAAKLRDVRGFEAASRELLPRAFSPVVSSGARLLPVFEATLGILLLTHRFLDVALGASCGLLGSFTIVLIRARRRGIMTACACFGTTAAGPVSRVTIVRSGLLWILCATLLVLETAGAGQAVRASIGQIGYGGLVGLLVLCTVGVGLAIVRLLTTVEQMVRPRHGTGSGMA